MNRIVIAATDSEEGSHWLSSTDMMSGLMLLFMFIAVAYMINASSERDEMRDVARQWAESKTEIYDSLLSEFRNDLPRWQAEIESRSLTVRFHEPTVLFSQGTSELTSQFKSILADFFPRYIGVLMAFRESISEIRVEGHTSSEWREGTSHREAYFANMVLSHDRSREVLLYCLSSLDGFSKYEWAEATIIASGMSSSRLVLRDGIEDPESSRRVEFRVRTNAEERLTQIVGVDKVGE